MSIMTRTQAEFALQMMRDGKKVRDEEGTPNAKYDAQLARYEQGDFNRYNADGSLYERVYVIGDAPMPEDDQPRRRSNPTGENATSHKAARRATEGQLNFINDLQAKLSRKIGSHDHELIQRASKVWDEGTSFNDASTLIDLLKNAVYGADDPTKVDGQPRKGGISENQVNLIMTMCAERGVTLDRDEVARFTREQFQNTFAELKATARTKEIPAKGSGSAARSTSAKSGPAAPGLYAFEGTVVKVQENRAHTGVYAKRLNVETGEYELVRGLQFKVTEKLTLEQATKIYQANHSLKDTCLACGRELTDEYSMTVGIGPVCREKM